MREGISAKARGVLRDRDSTERNGAGDSWPRTPQSPRLPYGTAAHVSMQWVGRENKIEAYRAIWEQSGEGPKYPHGPGSL